MLHLRNFHSVLGSQHGGCVGDVSSCGNIPFRRTTKDNSHIEPLSRMVAAKNARKKLSLGMPIPEWWRVSQQICEACGQTLSEERTSRKWELNRNLPFFLYKYSVSFLINLHVKSSVKIRISRWADLDGNGTVMEQTSFQLIVHSAIKGATLTCFCWVNIHMIISSKCGFWLIVMFSTLWHS